MKYKFAIAVIFSAILLSSAQQSLADTSGVVSGGIGQVASNPQQFGVAVCNNSGQALGSAVLIGVAVGNQNATIPSAAPIAIGQCAYSYLPYSQFGMQAEQTYPIYVTIAGNQTTYSITVPIQPSNNLTADIGSIFSGLWNWFVGLFKYL